MTDDSDLIPFKILQQDRQVVTHPLLGWINMEQVWERRQIVTFHGKWTVGELSTKMKLTTKMMHLLYYAVVNDVGNSPGNTWTCSI